MRRIAVLGALAASLAAFPAALLAAAPREPAPSAALQKFFDRVFQEDLKENPEKFIRFQSAMKAMIQRFKADREFALRMAQQSYPNVPVAELNQQLDFAAKVYWKGDGDMTRELYDHAVDVLVGSGRVSKAEMPSFEALVVKLPAK